MPEPDVHHWYGSLAMTVAMAATSPYPKEIAKGAYREFLKEHPPGNPLGDHIRQLVGKEKA